MWKPILHRYKITKRQPPTARVWVRVRVWVGLGWACKCPEWILECFHALWWRSRWPLNGFFYYHFSPLLTFFEPFLTLSGAGYLRPFRDNFGGPKWDQTRVILRWVWTIFWVDPGSFWGRLGIIWHRFGLILGSFWCRFDPLWGLLGPFLSYFWTIFGPF